MPCFRRQIVPRRLMETGKPQRRVCLLLPLLLGTSGANNPNDLRIAAGPQRSFSRRRESTANGLVVRGSSICRMVSSTSAAFLENLRGFLPNRPSRCHHAPVLSRPLLQHRTGGSWAARRLRAGNQGISRARAWGGNDLITPAPEFGSQVSSPAIDGVSKGGGPEIAGTRVAQAGDSGLRYASQRNNTGISTTGKQLTARRGGDISHIQKKFV